MKIAVPCPGVGHVWRGFESFALDLGAALHGDAQVVVYGGRRVAGVPARVQAVPTITRDGTVARKLVPSAQRYRLEQAIFTLLLAASLKTQPYDVVHVSDTLVAVMLMRLRQRLGLRFRLVFSNGGNRDPQILRQSDICQVLTPLQWESAVSAGVPEERLAMVPYGLSCASFARGHISPKAARERLGLPDDMRVVLSVAPLDSSKRLDHLIREIAAMGRRDIFLLAAGQSTAGTAALEAEAQRLLPGRYRFVTLPYTEVGWAYHAADVFALCSLGEGFGRAVLEAMAARVPVVLHDWPLFQWLVPNPVCRVDMAAKGALADRLERLLGDESLYEDTAQDNLENVLSRFDWSALKGDYLRMYEAALRSSPVVDGSR